MSDFILVAPMGWTEILHPDGVYPWVDFTVPVADIVIILQQSNWAGVDQLLIDMASLPPNKYTTNARLVSTDAGYKFWVMFANGIRI